MVSAWSKCYVSIIIVINIVTKFAQSLTDFLSFGHVFHCKVILFYRIGVYFKNNDKKYVLGHFSSFFRFGKKQAIRCRILITSLDSIRFWHPEESSLSESRRIMYVSIYHFDKVTVRYFGATRFIFFWSASTSSVM